MKKAKIWALLFLVLAFFTVWAVISQSKSFSFAQFQSTLCNSSVGWMIAATAGMLGFILFEGMALLCICEGIRFQFAPCDGLLSAYRIKRNLVIPVKQSRFSLRSLLAGDEICREFEGGICLVFRLCVNHYHRYCYVDRGMKGENCFIEGRLHTVRPIALETFPVFIENCREYTVIDTENFGRIIQMEVGAMLVGKIFNYHGKREVRRGQEKGRFLYGGSTVIVLLRKGAAKLPSGLFKVTAAGLEVPVKLGEKIGTRAIDE